MNAMTAKRRNVNLTGSSEREFLLRAAMVGLS
jgi:hypothetical protein